MRFVIGALFDRPRLSSSGFEPERERLRADVDRDPVAAGRLAIARAFGPSDPGSWRADGSERGSGDLNASSAEGSHGAVGNDRLVATVVGPVDPREAYRALSASILPDSGMAPGTGDVTGGSIDRPSAEPRGREVRQVMDIPRTHVWIAYRTSGLTDGRMRGLEVVAALLDSPDGQPRRRLVDEGLAFASETELWHGPRRGYLALHAETSPQNEAAAIRALQGVLEQLRSERVIDSELDTARRRASAKLARGVSTSLDRAAALEAAQVAGIDPSAPLDAPAKVLTVSGDEVALLARDLFAPGRELLVVVGPAVVETAP
jgi:predicted Zn-dependent peptidase